MPKPTLLTLIAFTCSLAHSQILSGKYDGGLNIAFNPQTNKVTGFFEDYTGLDETTGEPRFSCVFYLTGTYNKNGFDIVSYYPGSKKTDLIHGKMNIKDQRSISLKLVEDHGGCWNVRQFADAPAAFSLNAKSDWIEISYIESEKAFFHSNKSDASKRKAYVVKNDVIYIDKIENDWVHAKFFAKTTTEGWIKTESIHKD